mgnify:CR=1 FL=1
MASSLILLNHHSNNALLHTHLPFGCCSIILLSYHSGYFLLASYKDIPLLLYLSKSFTLFSSLAKSLRYPILTFLPVINALVRCIPSFVIIYAISFVLRQFQELKAVQYAFNGIRAGVLALLFKYEVSCFSNPSPSMPTSVAKTTLPVSPSQIVFRRR